MPNSTLTNGEPEGRWLRKTRSRMNPQLPQPTPLSVPDATIARARKLGATIQFGPEDIPGVGRFGVLEDPTGAVLALMKPSPRQEQR